MLARIAALFLPSCRPQAANGARRARAWLLAFLASFALLTALPAASQAQDLARFASPSGAQPQELDHSAWDGFLQRYLSTDSDGIARLDYDQARSALPAIAAYIEGLEAARPSLMTRAQAKAYWINFYNALTVKLVLEAYPISSIRQIDGILGFGGPWKKLRVFVEGQHLSLDHMEHGILRPGFADPRVHYAVNCASYSCPNLAARAFTPANLDTLLDQGAHAYVNHPRAVTFEGGRLQVSSIYEWFKEDFGGTDAAVIAHLLRYAEPELSLMLMQAQRISGDHYDWSLNDSNR